MVCHLQCGQNRQKVRPLIELDDHRVQAAETNLGTHVDVVIYTSGGLYQIGKELLQNNIHFQTKIDNISLI